MTKPSVCKTITWCLLASTSFPVASAFSTVPLTTTTSSTTQPASATQLHADRRQVLASSFAAAGLATIWTTTTESAAAAATNNEVDFGKVQDLLGGDAASNSASAQLYAQPPSGKRPTFLTDPTEEFKQNEAKAAEFKRAQLKNKREFQTILDRLQTDPNDGPALAKDLDDMRYLVQKNIGLPEGISKDEVVKQVRRRKAKKFWPTDVEIAYQDLLYEIMKKQSPNTDRDTGDMM